MTGRTFTERDIHLALDGELPADEGAYLQRWLDANPDMKALEARLAADRDLLVRTLGPVADEPVPSRMAALVGGRQGSAGAGRSLLWRAAAAAVLLALGGAGGYVLATTDMAQIAQPELQVAGNAVAAHRIYAAEKLHVVEVGADQKDHLVGWLSKRLGTKLTAPDLTAQGYSLVGGRLLPSGEAPAAQFMYQSETGERVSLYVTHCVETGETGFRLFEHEGARAFYWLDEGFGYAVAGALSEDSLLEIANTSYRQLLDAQNTSG